MTAPRKIIMDSTIETYSIDSGQSATGAAPQPVAISIENLTKRYGETLAVDQLSLSVPAGRLFGFLGPNGAGKSTTIGCLTGLIDPTSGVINLLGEQFTADSVELKQRIGVMPEGLALFDHLYAHEFLAFSARMYQLDEQTVRQRVEELLTVLDLTSTHRKRLAEFSTGMRKKIAFAAAIIHRPEILFLDEPFESIDPAGVAMLKDWLRRFVAGGRTVFMTTHVLETVERLCDDVAIIKSGRVAWRGDVGLLANGGKLECDGRQFNTLEALFLHLVGEKYGRLDWL
ncbi:MAG: Vitamin B12 import ATP-binding protein BtuD [Acidobacteria bacterium]|nr:Vitamin B12 import ATP-binding protein BtuD [Acidobacteriota bacterium]